MIFTWYITDFYMVLYRFYMIPHHDVHHSCIDFSWCTEFAYCIVHYVYLFYDTSSWCDDLMYRFLHDVWYVMYRFLHDTWYIKDQRSPDSAILHRFLTWWKKLAFCTDFFCKGYQVHWACKKKFAQISYMLTGFW